MSWEGNCQWVRELWDRTAARKSSTGGFYVCAGGLERLCKGLVNAKTYFIYSASYFNLGGLGALFGVAKPTKAPSWDGTDGTPFCLHCLLPIPTHKQSYHANRYISLANSRLWLFLSNAFDASTKSWKHWGKRADLFYLSKTRLNIQTSTYQRCTRAGAPE